MKRILPIRILLQTVTIVMTVMLVGILAIYAVRSAKSEQKALRVPTIIDISGDLFSAIQDVRLERALVASVLRSTDPADSAAQKQISARRNEFAKHLNTALTRISEIGVTGSGPIVASIRNSIDAYADMRRKVDGALLLTRDLRPVSMNPEWLAANNRVANAIDNLSSLLEDDLSQGDPYIASMMQIKQMTWVARSDSADDRFLLRDALASGTRLSEPQRTQLAVLAARIESDWKVVQTKARLATTPQELRSAVDNVDRVYFATYLPLRLAIISDLREGRPVHISGAELQKFTAVWQQSTFAVASTAFKLSRAHAAAQLETAKHELYGAIALMLAVTFMGGMTIWYVVRRVVHPITQITKMMNSVAGGNLEGAIPFEDRSDEIGSLARALRVFRDTEIEKEKLRIEKEGAEAANQAKSKFLASMSHELRTPLNAIIGFSEIQMKEMFGPINERYRRYASDINHSGTHLLALINEILDMSKLEAGKAELIDEPVDLEVVIQDAVRSVEPQAMHSNIQLSTSIAADLPMLRADSRRMRQILINLLSNAVKFTPEGGKVRVSCGSGHHGMALTIEDTGIGMAPAEIPKALEIFGQIDSKLSRKHEGTGLGLPLSQHLVNLHGGTLAIDSKPGFGTRVDILLPPERIIREASPSAGSRGKGPTNQYA